MIFEEFLNAGLIPIGGDDQVYKKLIEASKKLEAILEKDKSKVINYTLVGLDSNVTENEPVLAEVESVITQEWKLIRSQFTEMPIAIYRGIILQALENMGTKDPVFAAIIWHSGCNIFSLFAKKAKESDILSSFLSIMGDIAEKTAIKEWSINTEPKGIRLPAFNMEFEISDSEIDINELTEYFIAASGPNGSDGAARNDPNPYWTNGNQNWSYQFAPRAARGVANSVNTVISKSNQNTKKFIESFQKNATDYFGKIKTDVSAALKDTIQSSIAVERRSQLLWWKETLYSRTLRKGYRELDELENAIAMAFDLKNMLPKHSPISVMYILKESFYTVATKKEKIKVSDFLNLLKSKEKKYLVERYFERKEFNGRTDFVNYISEVIFSNSNIEDEILLKLGIKDDTEIEYEFISAWLLNSLIANSLTK